MLIRLVIVFIIFAAVLVFDAPNYKKNNKRGRAVYALSMAAVVYLGLDFAVGKDWPELHDAVGFIFSAPARMIINYFESKS
ncbi:hypothetical protein [Paenibacillus sp. LPE1-1-1.1]|uniref:hypothetical protein n=1 Tax=Paenibacillus sp. LPE1-1-1.1 TaxID=3135230 RepID=UPI00342B5DD2